MNKAKLIEALKLVIDAIEDDSTAEASTANNVEDTPNNTSPKKTVKSGKAEESVKETEESNADVTETDVKGMGYNDLKKFAQSLGIKAVGTREQIVAKVLDAIGGKSDNSSDDEEETVKEEKTPKNSKVVPISKKAKKEAPVEEAPVEEETEEVDEIAEAVRAEAEGMDITEIAEILQSVGIKASGKKEKMINLLIGAVKDGKLDFSDDDEDDEEEETVEEETEVEESSAEDEEVDYTEYHEEYDPSGLNNPENMTKKRAKAVASMIESELESIENGDTTEKDIKDFLNTLLNESEIEEYDIDNLDENEMLFLYFEVMKSLIDDDGDSHEPSDPYVIGEENVCCGHVLAYDEESGQYVCESCGESYEAE